MKRDGHRESRKTDGGSSPAGSNPPEPTAQAAFASYAAPLVSDAIAYANAVRDDPSPEALHKLRVSLRRLRSLWWAFAPLLEKGENTRQRALYKYLANAAGKTRDWDILIELIRHEDVAANSLTPTLEEARGNALTTSRETLTNADVKHLLREALTSASTDINTAHERVPLHKFASKRVAASERSLMKRAKRARRARRSNYAAFHDVRKAGKKLRYLLEFFEPVLSGSHKRTLKRLKQVQKRFGALNDIVASEMLLRDNASLLAGSGDTEGVLHWFHKERKRRMRSAAGLLRKL
ncbi:CHAD domain-containing protein [Paraburkholderia phenoliruptrix]|uniref:CHAD domain-containing protein n=1 Tax=Paraburkholderia phenoliruptrix TaxID=252970 RepID=UPI0028595FAE|nr:CHAD domain-containing protein [Paraburkholderia phenoliruptrix]MDR6390841.1 CHAD domain-containing protein [Paraburkholderia phenoliruptrix]